MSTIKDVAKCAGVSIATVSYILNNTKTVLPETRKRVMDAIDKLNYTPNATAQSFKTGKKYMIAFIMPDISNNYFANITKCLQNKLNDSGYSLILANTNEDLNTEITQLKYMTSGAADAIILASTANNFDEIKKYIPRNFPVVLLDRKLSGCPYDIISPSDKNTILQGVKNLYQKGHEKIGYIGDMPHLSTSSERQNAYIDALQQIGLPICDELIKHVSSLGHDAYYKTGELIKAGCTAIVIGNNTMTIDGFSYVFNHQSECTDVSILGYQHKDLPSLFYVNADVISSNEGELGNAAAEQILKRIKKPSAAQKEISISSSLIQLNRKI